MAHDPNFTIVRIPKFSSVQTKAESFDGSQIKGFRGIDSFSVESLLMLALPARIVKKAMLLS